MKRLLGFTAFFFTLVLAHGQGTVQFSNNAVFSQVQTINSSGLLVNAPVGFPVVYGLFYGTNANALALAPVLGAPSTTTAGVIWVNGAFSLDYQLSGTQPNDRPFVQVRGWSASFGSDWQAALNAYLVGAPGAYFGQTTILQIDPLGANIGPGTVIWQSAAGTIPNRFTPLIVTLNIPEPATLVLFAMGGLFLCLHRRR